MTVNDSSQVVEKKLLELRSIDFLNIFNYQAVVLKKWNKLRMTKKLVYIKNYKHQLDINFIKIFLLMQHLVVHVTVMLMKNFFVSFM